MLKSVVLSPSLGAICATNKHPLSHVSVEARPGPLPLPKLDTNGCTIAVFHPIQCTSGPTTSHVPILSFDVFPTSPEAGALVGLPLGLVLDACSILAGNKRGELQSYNSPHERVAGDDVDMDRILSPGLYRFVVVLEGGGLDYSYTLCPGFFAWTPPVAVPDRWKGGEPAHAPDLQAPASRRTGDRLLSEDDVCVVTGASSGIRSTHLVPNSESRWVATHWPTLLSYGGNPHTDLNSVRNALTLRMDLHPRDGLFVFAPYANSVVTLFVEETAGDLAYQYHLRVVDLPGQIRRGYLYICFALNVFEHLSPGVGDVIELEYRCRHPEISAVGGPDSCIWEDSDDESV
ncbi:hypothetical protein FB45DRAFT_1024016 [Roridomyces roridus]|uniref:HNH nuclease domain-containing protein n=1 Tax=Roridomyces roridus TaxID=1738132 RepID=A0AAD7C5A2_9AGAR|nr:hypothetical protein FB45DRAFT_1024016 [Roridomyces roridus]